MTHVLMIFLFYQSGLFVDLANSRPAGLHTKADCEVLALTETRTLPLQPGNDARWQYATCVEVQSLVTEE